MSQQLNIPSFPNYEQRGNIFEFKSELPSSNFNEGDAVTLNSEGKLTFGNPGDFFMGCVLEINNSNPESIFVLGQGEVYARMTESYDLPILGESVLVDGKGKVMGLGFGERSVLNIKLGRGVVIELNKEKGICKILF